MVFLLFFSFSPFLLLGLDLGGWRNLVSLDGKESISYFSLARAKDKVKSGWGPAQRFWGGCRNLHGVLVGEVRMLDPGLF